MPDFQIETERSLEGGAVDDVKAVHGKDAAESADRCPSLSVVRMRERFRLRPGVPEVVFRARSEDARKRFAVDVDLLVSLAPPRCTGRILDIEHRAHVVA